MAEEKKLLQERIVDRIVRDLAGRNVLDSAWLTIDEEVQEEIREKWRTIVRDEIMAVLAWTTERETPER